MADSLDATIEDKAATEAQVAQVAETTGVAEGSPPPDVSDPSPEQTHDEFLKEQLKESEEKSSEEPPSDESVDPEKGDEAQAEPETTDESTDPEAKKPEEDTAKSEDYDPADISDEELKAMKPDARNRFQDLANERNTITKRVEELTKYQEDVHATIKASNSTPEQMADMLEFTRMENSDNPEDKRAALNLVVAKMKALSAELGVKVPGTDILEGHEDLNKRVEAGEIELSDAEELAIGRNKQTHFDKQKEVETKNNDQVKSQEQVTSDVASAITSLFETRRTTDPDWDAKVAILQPYAAEIKGQFAVKDYPKLINMRLGELDKEFERNKQKPDPKEVLPSAKSSASSAKVEPTGHEAFVAQAFKG